MYIQFNVNTQEVYGVTKNSPTAMSGYDIVETECPEKIEIRNTDKLFFVDGELKYRKCDVINDSLVFGEFVSFAEMMAEYKKEDAKKLYDVKKSQIEELENVIVKLKNDQIVLAKSFE